MIDPDRTAPSSPSALERRERLLAIALIMGALLCFSGLDTMAKWLGQDLDPLQVVWARYVVSVAFVALFVNPWTSPGVTRTSKPVLQALRSFMLLASTIFNFFALRYLQLAEALSIQFTAPFMIALLAGPMLGEWVGRRRMIAIGIGFLGVLVIARPGFGGLHPAALLSVGGAFCYAVYGVLTRMLAAHDSSRTTMFYSGAAGVLLMTPIVPFVWSDPGSPLSWFLFIAIGFTGALGHWLVIQAHARAPAPVLAPFIYTQIVWMIALGYIVFGDIPDRWTLTGAAIVIASGIYLIYREQAVKRR